MTYGDPHPSMQKYRAKLQMKNDSSCSGDHPPQPTHIIQTAHQTQISSVDRAPNISAVPIVGGTDAPVPASWPSSSQQAVKDVFSDIAPMDVLTTGPPSSSYNLNTFPQVFFGPFSYQGPSLQASNTPPVNYAGDHVTAASQCPTGSLVPESFDAEIEAFFGSTEPTMDASENGAAAAGTFVPPDQADAVASAEEDIAMVAEMMAAPSDVHLAMASYEATALNTDDQFLFPLEALRGLDVPMDINNARVTDDVAITWLNGEGGQSK